MLHPIIETFLADRSRNFLKSRSEYAESFLHLEIELRPCEIVNNLLDQTRATLMRFTSDVVHAEDQDNVQLECRFQNSIAIHVNSGSRTPVAVKLIYTGGHPYQGPGGADTSEFRGIYYYEMCGICTYLGGRL